MVPSLCFLLGILIADQIRHPPLYYVAGVFCFILWLWRARLWTGALLFLSLGALIFVWSQPGPVSEELKTLTATQEKQILMGAVEDFKTTGDGRGHLIVHLSDYHGPDGWRSIHDKIQLSTPGTTVFALGDQVLFRSRLRTPHSFHNEGDFDSARYLTRKGIAATAWLSSPDEILLAKKSNLWGASFFQKVRGLIQKRLDEIPRPQAVAFIKAILLGDTSGLDQDSQGLLMRLGLSHLLAVSGLNVGMINGVAYAFFLFLLKRSSRLILFFPVRKLAALFTFIPLLFYLGLAGFSPSAARAGLMVGLYLVAVLLNRDRNWANLLAAAALILGAWDPTLLFERSFQLSFLATGALIFVMSQEQFSARGRLSQYALVSAGILLLTAPLASSFTHLFSIAGLLCNYIAIPLVGFFVLPLAFVGSLLSFIPGPLAHLAFSLDAAVVSMFFKGLHFLDPALSYLSWPLVLTNIEIVLFYAFVLFLAFSVYWRRAWLGAACFLSLFVGVFFWPWIQTPFSSTLQVHFLDVGQGDATLIEFPGGERWLVDAGGYLIPPKEGDPPVFNAGEKVLVPYFLRHRIYHLDKLILTHPHPEHFGGMEPLLKTIAVKEVWLPQVETQERAFQSLLQVISEKKIPLVRADASLSERLIQGVRLRVLHPRIHSPGMSLNDSSLVLKLTYGEQSILLTGDIEKQAEALLLESAQDLKSTVLKVPHHGSETSSTAAFLKAVSPRASVISCGYQNPFNFPRAGVLGRLREAGSQIYRTDLDGEVIVTTDGAKLWISQKGNPPSGRVDDSANP